MNFQCLYENKPRYVFHHLKHTFYHQNSSIIFCLSRTFQFHVICFVFFSYCVQQLFYQKEHQDILYALIFLFIPFALLTSLLSTLINEYILFFNPINSLILVPLNSSFILPNNFLFEMS